MADHMKWIYQVQETMKKGWLLGEEVGRDWRGAGLGARRSRLCFDATLVWAYGTFSLHELRLRPHLQHFQTLPLIYLHISLTLFVYIYSAFDLPVQVSFVFTFLYHLHMLI